ncbi:hypothetical protein ACLBXM_09450 [Xanthobacteraceae bacterium A53D]
MKETDSEDAFNRAARDVVALGPVALPNLTRRLIAAETDDQRIEITFLIAAILGQARASGAKVDLPPDLVPEVAALMAQPRELGLEGNLANLAGAIEPQPPEITRGLLSILARADNPGLRATTSAVIAMRGGQTALPLIQDALRKSTSARYSGDLARILRGTTLPPDVADILVALLKSDDAEARQAASQTLKAAGIRDAGQLDAALRDLEAARTDMQLIRAATAVRETSDGSARVVDALASALERARRLEERREIILGLTASGEAGLERLYGAVRAVKDPTIARQYILFMNSDAKVRKDPRAVALLVEMASDSETPAVAEEAAFGLARYGKPALVAIDAVLADDKTSADVRKRLSPVRERLAK